MPSLHGGDAAFLALEAVAAWERKEWRLLLTATIVVATLYLGYH
jgi:hypothetical protein